MEFLTALGVILTAIFTGIIAIAAANKQAFETTPKDKLVFSSILVRQLAVNNQPVPKIRIGFMLRNIAVFPIKLKIKEIRTELKNVHPLQGPDKEKKFRVFPGNTFSFEDYPIELENVPRRSQTLEGRIYVNLRYGRYQKSSQELTEDLEFENKVAITFDSNGNFLTQDFFEIF